MTRGWANSAQPSEKWFLSFSVWSESRQILVQFLFHSDIECHKSKQAQEALEMRLMSRHLETLGDIRRY